MLLSGLFWRKGRFLDSCSCSEPHNRTKEKSPNTNCVQAQPKWSECFRCHLRRERKGRIKEKSLNANCVQTQSGGRGWIRTTEVTDNRFTVCPLWPLGNSPIFTLLRCGKIGAGRRTRTPDLLITNQLLYQLSYTSIFQRLTTIPYQRSKVKPQN